MMVAKLYLTCIVITYYDVNTFVALD